VTTPFVGPLGKRKTKQTNNQSRSMKQQIELEQEIN
jgi:hypothetical protein